MCQFTIHFDSIQSGFKKVYCYYARRSPSKFLKILDNVVFITAIISTILTITLGFLRMNIYCNQTITTLDDFLFCVTPLSMSSLLIIMCCISRLYIHPIKNYYIQKHSKKNPDSLYNSLYNISITFHRTGGSVISSSIIPNKSLDFLYSDYQKIYFKKNKLVMLPYNKKITPTIYVPYCYFTNASYQLLKKWVNNTQAENLGIS